MQRSLTFRHPAWPYILPFATFLLLTGLAAWIPFRFLWLLYPFKTLLVGALLVLFRRAYTELTPQFSPLAIFVGLLVFVLWIHPEGFYPLLGEPDSIDPYTLAGPTRIGVLVWIGFRLLGAVVVVPIMEELFWRSFLLRYLINPDFKRVNIGTFSWSSLVWTVLLFGVEHHQWLVGMVAGLLYTLLLYRTKSLFTCILAHAIINAALGVYVLLTHQWGYW